MTGAAGLVGQNLLPRLKSCGYPNIVAIDKHPANIAILRRLHPEIEVIEADLAVDNGWQDAIDRAQAVVLLHAQIGGLDQAAFTANNVTATQRLLDVLDKSNTPPYLIHVSSSVVNSAAEDWYTKSKAIQEQLIVKTGLPAVVLRPTLMFGWFDRKHLGWLVRFMKRVPIFPIPGQGRYLRQPLYVGDFCDVIMACIDRRPIGLYNITGLERIAYIDLIREVKEASRAPTKIVRIPYSFFWFLLFTYGLFDRNPPFTTKQLKALATPDIFEVIDWPGIFGVKATPLNDALAETFNHPIYSRIALEF